MTLVRTSLLTGISVLVRILALLGINKVLAVAVGPAGYAVLGQFQNTVQILTTIASAGLSNGITKYTAEFRDDQPRRRETWRAAVTLALALASTMAVATIGSSAWLARSLLGSADYASVFRWLGAALVLVALNSVLLAIINGRKEVRLYVSASICGSLLALLMTSWLAYSNGLEGALVALATFQAVAFFATLAMCYRLDWFRWSNFVGRFGRRAATDLLKFASMTLASIVSVPASHLIVREILGEKFGWGAAGLWEAMWRLSGAYLMIITTTLGVYYLPRLSEIKSTADLRSEVLSGYKWIMPFALASALAIYLTRDFIVVTLFSPEFSPLRDLLAWQLVGDVLKIGGWLLAYVMLGKAMLVAFVVSEVLSAMMFVLLVDLLTDAFGLRGASMAHAANYFLYWSGLGFVIWRGIERGAFDERPPSIAH